MTYRVHSAGISTINAVLATDDEIAAQLGVEPDRDGDTSQRLVLVDHSNLEAWVLPGDVSDIRYLARSIAALADRLDSQG